VIACALGRAGISHAKRESDHATPAGEFHLLAGFFRADRILRRAWSLPMRPVRPNDGWCDDPESAVYNRHVTLPCRTGHEKLWRKDHLYDLVIVLDYNIHPRRKIAAARFFCIARGRIWRRLKVASRFARTICAGCCHAWPRKRC